MQTHYVNEAAFAQPGRAFVDRTGALSDPAVPVWELASGSVILIALAGVVSFVPARRVRRIAVAAALREE